MGPRAVSHNLVIEARPSLPVSSAAARGTAYVPSSPTLGAQEEAGHAVQGRSVRALVAGVSAKLVRRHRDRRRGLTGRRPRPRQLPGLPDGLLIAGLPRQ